MSAPFVGRERELLLITRSLDEGQHVVVTGRFGSGRTTLIRQLANQYAERRFVFLDGGMSKTHIRRAIESPGLSPCSRVERDQVVAVFDDLTRITRQKLHLLRGLLQRYRCLVVVIVDWSVPVEDVLRLRATLGAARRLELGPLGRTAAEHWFAAVVLSHRLPWGPAETRATARSTHGHPLTMQLTLADALSRRAARPSTTDHA